MADAVIHEIESKAKVEALVGVAITTILGIILQQVAVNGECSMALFVALGMFVLLFFGLQANYYAKFIIQKWMWIKEQTSLANIKHEELNRELQKLELQIRLKELEAQVG